MMAVGIVLPLIAIIFIISLLARAGSSGGKKFFQGRYLKRVWVAYLIILLASPIILYFIQGDETKIVERGSDSEAVAIHDRFYESLYERGQLDLQGIEPRKEFELDVVTSSLNIAYASEEFYKTVIIEKNKLLDKKIIVGIYVLPSVIDNFEFTHAIPMPQVELSGDRLEIGNPVGFSELNMSLFEKEFTITQFTGESWSSNTSHHSMSIFGDPILYLQIPEDMTIATESELIELIYIEEQL